MKNKDNEGQGIKSGDDGFSKSASGQESQFQEPEHFGTEVGRDTIKQNPDPRGKGTK